MKYLKLLWNDQLGATGAMGLILLATILAIGAIVGLTTLRDQIVQEMGDMAVAIESLDQSFTSPFGSYVDPGPVPVDNLDAEPGCMSVQIAPSDEGP